MQYAVSDIHGCYGKYVELLRRLDLKDSDTLYVLGDMIDRGPDGLKILLDMFMRPNIVPFLGNHEYAALTCLPWLVEELTEENTEPDVLLWRLKSVQGWMADGGDKTVAAFRRLSPDVRQDVLDILEDLTVYEETEAGGREFVLVHAGLGGFLPDKALDDYGLDELILSRPEPGETYFPHKNGQADRHRLRLRVQRSAGLSLPRHARGNLCLSPGEPSRVRAPMEGEERHAIQRTEWHPGERGPEPGADCGPRQDHKRDPLRV